jgi:hypothetical protein
VKKSKKKIRYNNISQILIVIFPFIAAILDAILDFFYRHHLCQFIPAVLETTNVWEHFGICHALLIMGSGSSF